MQEHSCLVSLGFCSVTSLHPSVKGPALCLPGSAFVFGIVVFCINPELVLCGKVAHPPCANREEAAPFHCGQLGCFTLSFQALSVVFTLYFLYALYHAVQNCSLSPDPLFSSQFVLGILIYLIFKWLLFVLIRKKGNNLFLVIQVF